MRCVPRRVEAALETPQAPTRGALRRCPAPTRLVPVRAFPTSRAATGAPARHFVLLHNLTLACTQPAEHAPLKPNPRCASTHKSSFFCHSALNCNCRFWTILSDQLAETRGRSLDRGMAWGSSRPVSLLTATIQAHKGPRLHRLRPERTTARDPAPLRVNQRVLRAIARRRPAPTWRTVDFLGHTALNRNCRFWTILSHSRAAPSLVASPHG